MSKKTNRFTINLNDDLLAIEKEVMRRERYRSHTECYESFLRYRLSNTHRAEGALAGFPVMMAA